MSNIAILASGSGSNAQKIMEHFSPTGPGFGKGKVVILLSDNPTAYALERAAKMGVPTAVFSRAEFADGTKPMETLRAHGVDFIVLAGFLRLIPANIIEAWPKRIVNIHPALLPAYGGKGMYGERVHRAVIEAGETQSGITIHTVDAHYDRGETVAQFTCEISPEDTPETLAEKIHELEHKHFSQTIEKIISL